MYKYEEPSLFSGRRGAALVAVIILHIGIVWAFYTGLAGKLVQTIIPPVEIAQIDKQKEVDKPPPPVAAPPPARPGTASTADPKHPQKIGEDYYPYASKRAKEEGRCIVLMT